MALCGYPAGHGTAIAAMVFDAAGGSPLAIKAILDRLAAKPV
jgi:hypothetical protein